MSLKRDMLSKKNWVVYGISSDKEKFGYKIPEIMINNGYNVIGVNKKYAGSEILGVKVYGSLDEIKQTVDCIDVVVNPKITMTIIDEAIKKGIKNIWLQPHTFNDEVIEKLEANNIKYVNDDCVYAILKAEEQ